MSPSLQGRIDSYTVEHYRKCWATTLSMNAMTYVPRVEFRLSPVGALEGEPRLLNPSSNRSKGPREQALAAVRRCSRCRSRRSSLLLRLLARHGTGHEGRYVTSTPALSPRTAERKNAPPPPPRRKPSMTLNFTRRAAVSLIAGGALAPFAPARAARVLDLHAGAAFSRSTSP